MCHVKDVSVLIKVSKERRKHSKGNEVEKQVFYTISWIPRTSTVVTNTVGDRNWRIVWQKILATSPTPTKEVQRNSCQYQVQKYKKNIYTINHLWFRVFCWDFHKDTSTTEPFFSGWFLLNTFGSLFLSNVLFFNNSFCEYDTENVQNSVSECINP